MTNIIINAIIGILLCLTYSWTVFVIQYNGSEGLVTPKQRVIIIGVLIGVLMIVNFVLFKYFGLWQ